MPKVSSSSRKAPFIVAGGKEEEISISREAQPAFVIYLVEGR